MSKKIKPKKNNLRLAGIFFITVFGLVILSLIVKLLFTVLESKFDGAHKFNVLIKTSNNLSIASFNPKARTISIINFKSNQNYNVPRLINVPLDGSIVFNKNGEIKDLPFILLKSQIPLGQKIEKLTFLDLFRLFLYARTVPENSVYTRDFSKNLNDFQINTIVSLTFQDPTIYEENKSIEVINSTKINGLGNKVATFISNIGGNPILISSTDIISLKSKILYNNEKSYTVTKLSSYFGIPIEKSNKKSIADVIIIVGRDLAEKLN